MPLTHAKRPPRPGFTLIELLMVILIIGILASLLLAAVFRAVGQSDVVRAQNDISQLTNSVEAFKQAYSVPYIPSRLFLFPIIAQDTTGANPAQYNTSLGVGGVPNNPLHYESFNYITRVWPRISQTAVIAWNPSGGGVPATGLTLEGQECLVFFLGGIQLGGPNRCTGFSTNPSDPSAHINLVGPVPPPPFVIAGANVKGPFYDFPSDRLERGHGPANFFAYLDTYGRRIPYAYFSAYKQANGYNRFFPQLGNSDCATLGLFPYAEVLPAAGVAPRYFNSTSFQIICAGSNGAFGRGSTITDPLATWSRAAPNDGPCLCAFGFTDPNIGADDQSNFHNTIMGTPGR